MDSKDNTVMVPVLNTSSSAMTGKTEEEQQQHILIENSDGTTSTATNQHTAGVEGTGLEHFSDSDSSQYPYENVVGDTISAIVDGIVQRNYAQLHLPTFDSTNRTDCQNSSSSSVVVKKKMEKEESNNTGVVHENSAALSSIANHVDFECMSTVPSTATACNSDTAPDRRQTAELIDKKIDVVGDDDILTVINENDDGMFYHDISHQQMPHDSTSDENEANVDSTNIGTTSIATSTTTTISPLEQTEILSSPVDSPVSDDANPTEDEHTTPPLNLSNTPLAEIEATTTSLSDSSTVSSSSSTEKNDSDELKRAKDIIRHLQMSRDAMQVSINGLKTLAENERTIATVVKRQLVSANQRLRKRENNSTSKKTNVEQHDNSEMKLLMERLEKSEKELAGVLERVVELKEQHKQVEKQMIEKQIECDRLNDSNIALREETKTTGSIISDLLAQIESKEKHNIALAIRVRDETAKSGMVQEEVGELKKQLKDRNANEVDISKKRDVLLERVRIMDEETKERNSQIREADRAAIEKVAELRNIVDDVMGKLKGSNERVCELEAHDKENKKLRSRVVELERDLRWDHTERGNVLPGNLDGGDVVVDLKNVDRMSSSDMKRKLMELKIARNVITAKDSVLKEMREAVKEAESNVSEDTEEIDGESQSAIEKAEETVKEAESRIHDLENSVEEWRQKAIEAESRIATQENNDTDGNENNETATCDSEQQKEDYSAELKQLRVLLASSRQEILRLRRQINGSSDRNNAPPAVVNDKTGSPCSMDGMSVRNVGATGRNGSNELLRLADMEAAGNLSPRDGASSTFMSPRCSIPGQTSGNGSEGSTLTTMHATTLMASSVISGIGGVGTNEIDLIEGDDELGKARARVVALQDALESMERELDGKLRECKAMENHIDDVMTPAVEGNKKKLEEKVDQLNRLQKEFQTREMEADEMKSELEEKLRNVTAQFDHTVLALQSSKQRLGLSNDENGELRKQIDQLENEKSELKDLVDDLRHECEHREKALVFLRRRLVQVEGAIANVEQTADDLREEKERLERELSVEQGHRRTSDERAARKDSMVHNLEQEHVDLVKKHASVAAQLREQLQLVRELHGKTKDFEQALDVNESSMQKQAQKVARLDEEYSREIMELTESVKARENEIKGLRKEVSAVNERANTLSASLAASAARLRLSEDELINVKKISEDRGNLLEQQNNRIDILQRELTMSITNGTASKSEVAKLNIALSNAKIKSTKNEEMIASTQNDKARVERELHETRKKVGTEREGRELVHGRMIALEGDIDGLRKELQKSVIEVMDRTSEAEALGMSLAECQERAGRAESSLNECEKAKNELEVRIRHVEVERDGNKRDLDLLAKQSGGRDSILKEFRRREEVLNEKCVELDRLSECLALADARLHDMESTVGIAEREVDEKNEIIAQFQKDNRSIRKLMNEKEKLESDLAQSRDAISKTEMTRKANEEVLMKTVSELGEAFERVEKEKNNLEKQLARSLEMREQLTEQMATSNKEVACEKIITASLRVELQKLQRKTHVRSSSSSSSSRMGEPIDDMGNDGMEEAISGDHGNSIQEKEKTITNLQTWCNRVSLKLRTAEKSLIGREADLEVCHQALQRLETRLEELNDKLRMKESEKRKMKSTHGIEVACLTSRVESLRTALQQVEHESNIHVATSRSEKIDGDELNATDGVYDKLSRAQARLRLREMDVTDSKARNEVLQKSVEQYERDLMRAQRRADELKTEMDKTENEEKCMTLEKQSQQKRAKMFSAQDVLLMEIRRMESELKASQKSASGWQLKAIASQPVSASASKPPLVEDNLSYGENATRISWSSAGPTSSLKASNSEGMIGNLFGSSHGNGHPLVENELSRSLCTVTFTLRVCVDAGLNLAVKLFVLGGDITLGQWNERHKIALSIVHVGSDTDTSEFNTRKGVMVIGKCEAVVPSSIITGYKYVADVGDGKLVWETGHNRVLRIGGHALMNIEDEWRGSQ